MDDKTQIEIRVKVRDIQESYKTADDNAWEHAKEAMNSLDFGMGDDEFAVVYQELSKRYAHNVSHLQFFMMTALLMVKTLQENGLMTIFVDGESLRDVEVKERIGKVASVILNSYMWLAAGYELTWLDNDELPEQISVVFNLDSKNLIESEDDYE